MVIEHPAVSYIAYSGNRINFEAVFGSMFFGKKGKFLSILMEGITLQLKKRKSRARKHAVLGKLKGRQGSSWQA